MQGAFSAAPRVCQLSGRDITENARRGFARESMTAKEGAARGPERHG
jgi:hypothetical protein